MRVQNGKCEHGIDAMEWCRECYDTLRAVDPPVGVRFKYLSEDDKPIFPDGYSAPLDMRTTREMRETKK